MTRPADIQSPGRPNSVCDGCGVPLPPEQAAELLCSACWTWHQVGSYTAAIRALLPEEATA